MYIYDRLYDVYDVYIGELSGDVAALMSLAQAATVNPGDKRKSVEKPVENGRDIKKVKSSQDDEKTKSPSFPALKNGARHVAIAYYIYYQQV